MIMCGEWRSSLTIGYETLGNHTSDIYPATGLYIVISPFVTKRFSNRGFPVNLEVVIIQGLPGKRGKDQDFSTKTRPN